MEISIVIGLFLALCAVGYVAERRGENIKSLREEAKRLQDHIQGRENYAKGMEDTTQKYRNRYRELKGKQKWKDQEFSYHLLTVDGGINWYSVVRKGNGIHIYGKAEGFFPEEFVEYIIQHEAPNPYL